MGLLESILGGMAGAGGGQPQQGANNPLIDIALNMLTHGGQGGGGGLGSILGGALGGQGQGGGLGGLGGALSAGQGAPGGTATGMGGMGGALAAIGGIGGLIALFQRAGLGDLIQSWISHGQNQPISGDQLQQVLGPDAMGQIAGQLGTSHSDAAGQLSQVLPQIIDALTPHGQVPQGGLGGQDAMMSVLQGMFGGRR